MTRLPRVGLSAILLVASVSSGQQAGMSPLKPLAFLAGRWISESGSEVQEESWSPVVGNSMTGSFRVIESGKAVFYEFWTMEMEDNRPVMKMKHFNAGLAGWEEKDVSVKMPLVSSAEDDAVFAQSDGNVSLHYHRTGNTLRCTVHHVKDGKPSDEVFTFKRAIGN